MVEPSYVARRVAGVSTMGARGGRSGRLKPLPFTSDVFVSLNPIRQPAPNLVLAEIDYEHPIFDVHAIQAQSQLHWLKSQPRTHFAGAWMGYGFHEDGLQSGLQAADAVLQALRRNWAIAAA